MERGGHGLGRKTVRLISKTVDSQKLYTGVAFGQQNNTSAVDIEAIEAGGAKGKSELERFPMVQELLEERGSTLAGELFPGDVLYIPAKWWHHVRSLDFSISVNAWWR